MSRFFARFGCNDCGASFHTQHGSDVNRVEMHCEACDHVELVNGTPSHLCPKCSGAMKTGLDPMCPRCSSRNTLVLVPGMFFD